MGDSNKTGMSKPSSSGSIIMFVPLLLIRTPALLSQRICVPSMFSKAFSSKN
jgi:hypothetical protein